VDGGGRVGGGGGGGGGGGPGRKRGYLWSAGGGKPKSESGCCRSTQVSGGEQGKVEL
jgi:hypothetical protein